MSAPLHGLRVLDLCRLLPGAFATGLLGDLGAEVIKVEQPGTGDPMRAYEPKLGDKSAFSWITDRNKRSIALNLRTSAGSDALRRLAGTSAAAVESFRPGVADRLGVGAGALRAVNPALVYCSISGYGADGPLRLEAGHDINYLGRSGVLGLTGVDGQPVVPGVQVADLAGGALMGIVGLLAALLHAERTGEGDHVDVSMTDGAFSLLTISLGTYFGEARLPGPGTELLTGGVPCYGVYTCADGRHLTVGALEPQFWQNLCNAVDRPDLLGTREDPGAIPYWRSLFASRPRDEWLALLDGQDACVGPVNDLAEAVADPQLTHRNMIIELDGRPQLGTPLKLSERPATIRAPAPALGADTRDLLAEAGYEEREIERLLADGAAQAAA